MENYDCLLSTRLSKTQQQKLVVVSSHFNKKPAYFCRELIQKSIEEYEDKHWKIDPLS